jgi:hypothetical protein
LDQRRLNRSLIQRAVTSASAPQRERNKKKRLERWQQEHFKGNIYAICTTAAAIVGLAVGTI